MNRIVYYLMVLALVMPISVTASELLVQRFEGEIKPTAILKLLYPFLQILNCPVILMCLIISTPTRGANSNGLSIGYANKCNRF